MNFFLGLEYFKSNLPEDAYLQTKILELNLYENTKAPPRLVAPKLTTSIKWNPPSKPAPKQVTKP